jgi:hypothetical protein
MSDGCIGLEKDDWLRQSLRPMKHTGRKRRAPRPGVPNAGAEEKTVAAVPVHFADNVFRFRASLVVGSVRYDWLTAK